MHATQRAQVARAAAAGGRRDRNKADKLQRICAAARDLFADKGYEDTTLREIARRANVGLGTLFSYAADKRDLLYLIFNDELEQVTQAAFDRPRGGQPFVTQLIAVFREYYRFFGGRPSLARLMLRELTFYGAGPAARHFDMLRGQLQDHLADLVAAAKRQGRLTGAAPARQTARLIYSVYAIEIRRWIGEDKPDMGTGLRSLAALLRLQIKGFDTDRT